MVGEMPPLARALWTYAERVAQKAKKLGDSHRKEMGEEECSSDHPDCRKFREQIILMGSIKDAVMEMMWAVIDEDRARAGHSVRNVYGVRMDFKVVKVPPEEKENGSKVSVVHVVGGLPLRGGLAELAARLSGAKIKTFGPPIKY